MLLEYCIFSIKIRIKSPLDCLLYRFEFFYYVHTLLDCAFNAVLQVSTLAPDLAHLFCIRFAFPHWLHGVDRSIVLFLGNCITAFVLSWGNNILRRKTDCLCMIVGRELLLRVNLACIIVLMLVATCVLVTGVYMLVAGISFLMQRSIVDGGWLLERKIRNRLFFSFIVQHIHELLQYFFILRIHTHIHLLVVFLQSFLLVSNLYECYLLLGLLVGGEIATSCLLVT